MGRRRVRRLTVASDRYLWSVSPNDTAPAVHLRKEGSRGELVVTFELGPGRFGPDGLLPSGMLMRTDGQVLNLNEPGVVRALLDQALAGGWAADDPTRTTLDGWDFFDAASIRP
ncbi:hypothetical protein [Kineosporia babensis]|uniref:Uncharacterized protein n=1 Tax=Kineosporia babensis TaxID=499548 RepID=A0A9X1SZC6_9ACTN|nr:hypothetical protein [Kineosporia babensis]MCD5311878.1 hypothetical protein [Kineosporia babensis]